MISKFFEFLYPKIFINIIVENLQSVVYVEIVSKGKVVDGVQKSFETTTVNAKMLSFLQQYIKESQFYYISLLDKSSGQGAVPTCVASQMQNYYDMRASQYICYSKNWAFYTSEYDLEAIKHEYRSIGIDFIFSPFAILANFFKDKIETTLAMFVLIEDNYLSFCIFDNSKLLYAQYLDMQRYKDDELLEASMENDDDDMSLDLDSINLEEIDLDSSNERLDDLSDIEDLDISDDIDEFSEEEDVVEIKNSSKNDYAEDFSEDYQRFSLIQSALSSFYKDPKYNSQFIENIYVADGVGVHADLKGYLEDEMFLNVYIRKIDLGMAVCEMAKAEVK